jgi:hypothetical protein
MRKMSLIGLKGNGTKAEVRLYSEIEQEYTA